MTLQDVINETKSLAMANSINNRCIDHSCYVDTTHGELEVRVFPIPVIGKGMDANYAWACGIEFTLNEKRVIQTQLDKIFEGGDLW